MADARFQGIQGGAGSSPSPAANPQVKPMIAVSDPYTLSPRTSPIEASVQTAQQNFFPSSRPGRGLTGAEDLSSSQIVSTKTCPGWRRSSVRGLGNRRRLVRSWGFPRAHRRLFAQSACTSSLLIAPGQSPYLVAEAKVRLYAPRRARPFTVGEQRFLGSSGCGEQRLDLISRRSLLRRAWVCRRGQGSPRRRPRLPPVLRRTYQFG